MLKVKLFLIMISLSACSNTGTINTDKKNNSVDFNPCHTLAERINNESDNDKKARVRFLQDAVRQEVKIIVDAKQQRKEKQQRTLKQRKADVINECKAFARGIKSNGASPYKCALSRCVNGALTQLKL
ncbi:MAG: hypothetical protein KAG28_00980 [Cocleimonas sp.]|nr:hypothetical protein [Cocleimonas sp.]